jgi:hypothetical protein
MQKRFSHIILVFLLLAATTGMAVSKHYCDNYLISTSFYTKSEPCCESDNHCHDEEEVFQLEVDFTTSQSPQLPYNTGLDLFVNVSGNEVFNNQIFTREVYPYKNHPSPHTYRNINSILQVFLL